MKKGQKSNEIAGRLGINAVEKFFLDAKWLFREQPISDWGIDAHVEEVGDDGPTGRLLALQIKTGPSYFKRRGKNYVFYGKQRHLEYWDRHSLPVFLILHDPDQGVTLWQKIEASQTTAGKRGAWSIEIPPTNILSRDALPYFSHGIAPNDKSVRRLRASLDLPLMLAVEKHDNTFLTVEEWVNKTLNFRKSEIRFDDADKDAPDIEMGTWLPAVTISDFLHVHFPWLECKYICPVEEYHGEIAEHRLEVRLNDLGKALVLTEQYFEDGPGVTPEPEAADPEEYMEDEEYQEYRFQQAQEQDWENEAAAKRDGVE